MTAKGLLSGQRDTNYINTQLNRTYFMAVQDDIEKLFPDVGKLDYQVHKGDDVAATSNNWVYNTLLTLGMHNAGHVG